MCISAQVKPNAWDIPKKTVFDIKFDEPVESESWYMNLYPTVDTEMNGVYYGPYDNIESLLDGILKWQNAYRVKYCFKRKYI